MFSSLFIVFAGYNRHRPGRLAGSEHSRSAVTENKYFVPPCLPGSPFLRVVVPAIRYEPA